MLFYAVDPIYYLLVKYILLFYSKYGTLNKVKKKCKNSTFNVTSKTGSGSGSGGKILDPDLVWNYCGSETLGKCSSFLRGGREAGQRWPLASCGGLSVPDQVQPGPHVTKRPAAEMLSLSAPDQLELRSHFSVPDQVQPRPHAVMLSLSAPDHLVSQLHFSVPVRGGQPHLGSFSPGRGFQMSPFHSWKNLRHCQSTVVLFVLS